MIQDQSDHSLVASFPFGGVVRSHAREACGKFTAPPRNSSQLALIPRHKWRACSQAHRHTGTQAHRHTGTQAHRYTGTQAHRYTGTQAHRHTGTRHTGTQAHGYTGTQAHRYTGTQCWINYFTLLNLPVVTFASSYNTEVRVCLGIINVTFDSVKRLQ